MVKSRKVTWLFTLAGALWMLAGIRDLFAPGFFSISGRTVTSSDITVDFAIGSLFLIIASSQAVGFRKPKQ